MKVLNYGSINIDYVYKVPHFIKPGETLSAASLVTSAGGKGANQSAALAKAGVSVYHAGKIGSEGGFILDLLGSYGVNTEYVKVTSAASGHAIIQIDQNSQNGIMLFAGENHNIQKDEIDAVFRHFSAGDWLVLQNEINNLAYLIKQAKSRGMRICLNIAPYDEELQSLPLKEIDLIVANEVEGAGLTGIDEKDQAGIIEAIKGRFHDQEFLLTVGKAGSYWICKDEVIYQDIIDYPVVDTTAAGDTFIGYFLASRIKGYQVNEALYYATKASGIAVSGKGAMESIPIASDVYC